MKNETTVECLERWSMEAAKKMVGLRVTGARYLTPQEADAIGWDHSCLVIEFNDGSYVFPSSDDEGNAAGALFGSWRDLQTIPVIRL